jgi:hypothetical protein
LFPSDIYRTIWHIVKQQESKLACKYFVKLLFLASKLSQIREEALAKYVLRYHEIYKKLPTIENCSSEFGIISLAAIPVIITSQHSLSNYNQLLEL